MKTRRVGVFLGTLLAVALVAAFTPWGGGSSGGNGQ